MKKFLKSLGSMPIPNKINDLIGKTIGYKLSKHNGLTQYLSYRQALEQFLVSNIEDFRGRVLEVGPGLWDFVEKLVIQQEKKVDIYKAIDPQPRNEQVISGSVYNLKDLFPDESFDLIVCCDVLEHVKDPALAISSIYHRLKDGGILLASTPFKKHLHGTEYGDYWRFTRQGWEHLLHGFQNFSVQHHGDEIFPVSYFIKAIKQEKTI